LLFHFPIGDCAQSKDLRSSLSLYPEDLSLKIRANLWSPLSLAANYPRPRRWLYFYALILLCVSVSLW